MTKFRKENIDILTLEIWYHLRQNKWHESVLPIFNIYSKSNKTCNSKAILFTSYRWKNNRLIDWRSPTWVKTNNRAINITAYIFYSLRIGVNYKLKNQDVDQQLNLDEPTKRRHHSNQLRINYVLDHRVFSVVASRCLCWGRFILFKLTC